MLLCIPKFDIHCALHGFRKRVPSSRYLSVNVERVNRMDVLQHKIYVFFTVNSALTDSILLITTNNNAKRVNSDSVINTKRYATYACACLSHNVEAFAYIQTV